MIALQIITLLGLVGFALAHFYYLGLNKRPSITKALMGLPAMIYLKRHPNRDGGWESPPFELSVYKVDGKTTGIAYASDTAYPIPWDDFSTEPQFVAFIVPKVRSDRDMVEAIEELKKMLLEREAFLKPFWMDGIKYAANKPATDGIQSN